LSEFIAKAPGIEHDPGIMSISMKYQQIGNSTEKLDSEVVSEAAAPPKKSTPKKQQKKPQKQTPKKVVKVKKEKKQPKKLTPKLEKKVVATQSNSLNKATTPIKKKPPEPIKKPIKTKETIQETVKASDPVKVSEPVKTAEPINELPTVTPPKIPSKPRYKLGSSENPKPSYPSLARKKGWGGVVIIGVYVNKDGSIKEMNFAKSTDFGILNYEAWETVLNKWTFEPLSNEDGSAIEYIEIPFHFGNK